MLLGHLEVNWGYADYLVAGFWGGGGRASPAIICVASSVRMDLAKQPDRLVVGTGVCRASEVALKADARVVLAPFLVGILPCLLLITDTISVSPQKDKAWRKGVAELLLCSMLAMSSGERVLVWLQPGQSRPKVGGQQRRPFVQY